MHSDLTQEVTIVIPCYNEADRIDLETFRFYLEQQPLLRYVFVNDGSTDNTLSLLNSFNSEFPEQISVLSLEKNSGKGEAIRYGLNANPFKSPYFGYLDADLSTPVHEILRLSSILEEDQNLISVFGSRLVLLGHRVHRTWHRFLFGRVFMTVMNTLLDFRVYDSQCGAKVFRTARSASFFKEPFITSWLFDIEVLCRIKNKSGLSAVREQILEVPLLDWKEVGGSKIKLTEFIKFPYQLLQVWKHYKKPDNEA